MASKLRFHLDEHISHAIAQALRQRGVDVTTTVEVGLRTLSDEAQMEYIQREQRVFVTSDAGFLRRSAEGQPHYGVVYYSTNTRSIGQVVTYLMLMYEIFTPEEIVGQIEYLP